MENNQSLTLFQFGGLEATNKVQSSVFSVGPTVRKLKDGSIVENGTLWKPQKQSDAKKNLGLTRKDQKQEFDQATAEAKNAMYLKFRTMILNSDPSKIGLERLALKKDAKGLWTIQFTGKEITDAMRVGVLTPEKIAKAFNCTIEEAEIKLGIRKAPVVNVSEVKGDNGPSEEELMKQMEADEAKALEELKLEAEATEAAAAK